MPKISLCQQKYCSIHCFFHWHRSVVMQQNPALFRKSCAAVYLCLCQDILRCCPRGQPSLGTVCTPTAQPSHSRGKHSAKWHPEGGLRSIIPDLQSWQCSFTTPPCDAAVSHSFSFSVQRTIVDGHRLHGGFSDKYLLEHLMPQNKTRFPSPSCCECFGCLQPCQTGYVSAHFVQNTLESNTDTNTKLPSSLLPSCILRGYSRGTAKGKKV